MSEALFVLKSLLLTGLVITVLQVRIGERSIEEKVSHMFRDVGAASWVQSVADGGALVAAQGYAQAKSFVLNLTGAEPRPSQEQRASR